MMASAFRSSVASAVESTARSRVASVSRRAFCPRASAGSGIPSGLTSRPVAMVTS